MSTANRFLELPLDAPRRGFSLRYGFQRGMILVYRAHVDIYRTSSSIHGVGSQHEELEARLRVRVIDVDESDRGARLIVAHEPIFHRIGTRNIAISDRTVVYTRQNEYGEVIESTHPSGGVNLMLPRMPVTVGSSWREVERFVPPGGATSLDLVREYRLEEISGSEVRIKSRTEDLTYEAETDEGAFECTTSGKGEFTLDTEWGVVSRQSVETMTTSRSAELTFEVQTVFAMELSDEE
jgi:hypothetical protein